MAFSFDDRTVRDRTCSSCGAAFRHVTGTIDHDGSAYAVYFAACHGEPEGEAQIDVVPGTWGADPPVDDHVTFSCRLRSDGAMAVDATVATAADDRLLGRRLTRDDALADLRVAEFWAVIDFLAGSDPTVHDAVYGTASIGTR